MTVTIVTTMSVGIRTILKATGIDMTRGVTLDPEMIIIVMVADIMTIIDTETKDHLLDTGVVDILDIHHRDAQIPQSIIQGTDHDGIVRAWIHLIRDIEVEVEVGAEAWIDGIAIIGTMMIITVEETVVAVVDDPNIGMTITTGNLHLCHHHHNLGQSWRFQKTAYLL